jgi:hypothetical protein
MSTMAKGTIDHDIQSAVAVPEIRMVKSEQARSHKGDRVPLVRTGLVPSRAGKNPNSLTQRDSCHCQGVAATRLLNELF